MLTFTEKIAAFTVLSKIAVTGVSTTKPDAANLIFRKLHQSGLTVFPINPRSREVEGTTCYPNLSSLPSLPEGVVIASPPNTAKPIIEECLQLGIKHVWLHSSVNKGSYDSEAVKFGEDHGISVIPAGCPMMYFKPVDFGHRCMKWIFHLTGKIPRK
jgi:predicted CoA-binding protein